MTSPHYRYIRITDKQVVKRFLENQKAVDEVTKQYRSLLTMITANPHPHLVIAGNPHTQMQLVGGFTSEIKNNKALMMTKPMGKGRYELIKKPKKFTPPHPVKPVHTVLATPAGVVEKDLYYDYFINRNVLWAAVKIPENHTLVDITGGVERSAESVTAEEYSNAKSDFKFQENRKRRIHR